MSTVVHDKEKEIFFIEKDGSRSELRYRRVSENVLDYFSTFVPPENRGQGLAEKLAESALDFALDHGYYVIPSCWYVSKYIDRHIKYQSLLQV